LFLARRLLSRFEWLGYFRVERVEGEIPLPGVPNLALRSERAPNGTGARLLGYGEDEDGAIASLKEAAVVLVLDDPLDWLPEEVLGSVENLLYLGTVLPPAARRAKVVLPIANVAEEDGTFVNRDGRVQRYFQAKPAPGMARPAWWVLGQLIEATGAGEAVFSAAAAFELLAAAEQAFSGLSYERLGLRGALVAASEQVEVGR
jgi:NADH-quinone oxidoreductase subunit G